MTDEHKDRESALPVGDSALISATLEAGVSAVNYHAWICDLVEPHLGEDPLEVGSGLGDYAERWLSHGVPRMTVSDVDPPRHAHLVDRFAGRDNVEVSDLNLLAADEAQHTSVVAINVLEHIEDDVAALRGASTLLRPGGKVVLWVPAFMFNMSDFDRTVGHYRRYRRSTLRPVMEAAGFRVDQIRYVNAPGVAAWFLGMKVLKLPPVDGPRVERWDRVVTRATRAVEERVRVPFGNSVFAVGIKR